jgi:putative DNA primase/helicase
MAGSGWPTVEGLAQLLNAQRTPSGWIASCPVPGHGKGRGDRTPSLSIHGRKDRRDGASWTCHAGCPWIEVRRALEAKEFIPLAGGLPLGRGSKALTAKAPAPHGSRSPTYADWRTPVAVYEYRDEHGTPRSQVRRYVTGDGRVKDFRPWTADPASPTGWRLGIADEARVLYRLDQIVGHPESTVWLVEGEKDADRLAGIGLLATTSQGGCAGWEAHAHRYIPYLAGRHVVILPDHDQAGQKYATSVATSLAPVAASVRIVQLQDHWPALPEAGDVSDWLDADPDHGIKQLHAFADGAADFLPPEDRSPSVAPTRTTGSGSSAADTEINDLALTDLGNAERFYRDHGAEIRVTPGTRDGATWWRWEQVRWAPDAGGARTMARVHQTVKRLAIDPARSTMDDASRRAWDRHALRSQSLAACRALLGQASADPRFWDRHTASSPDPWDADPWAWNLGNGTYDLRTGVLRAHDRTDYITKLTTNPDGSPAYVATTSHPDWDAWLEFVQPDADVRACLQELAGACATGAADDERIWWFQGTGANGKGTFLSVVRAAIGADYVHEMPLAAIVARDEDGGAAAPQLLALKGRRMVILAEARADVTLDEATIKRLTSAHEPVTARGLYQSTPTEFVPTHTMIVHANHPPTFGATDDGIRRRVAVLPWLMTVPESVRDPTVKTRLMRAEVLAGVRWWVLQGARTYAAQRRIQTPMAVREATEAMWRQPTHIDRWLADRCVRERGRHTGARRLWLDQRAWCGRQGLRHVSPKQLSEDLAERGFVSVRHGEGVIYADIALKPD